jgi:hypothetical protein
MELLKPCSKADYPAYSVAFTGTAGNTDAWAAGPQGVLVWASQACYVEVGVAAVATTASTPIPANTPFYIALQTSISGAPWRVSAIQVSTGGTVYCKPINKE